MSPAALETTRLWLATLADPLAIVVFGAILVQRLAVLRRDLRDELRAGFDNIVQAIRSDTPNVSGIRRYPDYKP